MAAGHARGHACGNFHGLAELHDVLAVELHEPCRRLAQRGRHRFWHHRLAEVRILPELHFRGRHVDAHVRAQLGLDASHVQPADVIHVHMGNHDIGDRCEVDASRFQAQHRATGAREVFETVAHARIDQDQAVTAAHERDIQRPVEHVTLQEAIIEPFVAVRFAHVGGHRGSRQRQNAIADQQDIDVTHAHGVAGRHELAEAFLANVGDDRLHIMDCFAHFHSSWYLRGVSRTGWRGAQARPRISRTSLCSRFRLTV
ncbi:hypothetical protein D3C71_1426380 [compost metagenome]